MLKFFFILLLLKTTIVSAEKHVIISEGYNNISGIEAIAIKKALINVSERLINEGLIKSMEFPEEISYIYIQYGNTKTNCLESNIKIESFLYNDFRYQFKKTSFKFLNDYHRGLTPDFSYESLFDSHCNLTEVGRIFIER
jgi:hypothetical protein